MKKILFLIVLLNIVGCAANPQLNVNFEQKTMPTGAKVGVVLSEIPKNTATYPGAGCLLCLAAASATNAKVSSYIKSIEHDTLSNIETLIADGLKTKGYIPSIIEAPIMVRKLPKIKGDPLKNKANRDYSSYKKSHNVDYLYVVDFGAIGLSRTYSSYIATSAPGAFVRGTAFLVDLSNNTYIWYRPLDAVREADGEWKEPPEYPGLTNAFFQVLESTRDTILSPISQ